MTPAKPHMHEPVGQRLLRFGVEHAARAVFGSREMGDWILEKAVHPRALAALAGNLAAYRLGLARTPRIVSLAFEPVFGCNLRCRYCWGQLEQDAPPERPAEMPFALFEHALDTAPSSVASANFVGWGEPLRHPRLAAMIACAAGKGFRTNLTSNCTLLRGETLESLAAAPLDVLNVSTEPDDETSRGYRGVALDRIRSNVEDFVAANGGRTTVKLSVVVHPGNVDRLEEIWAAWGGLARYAKLIPLFTTSPETVRTSPCLEAWRGHLTILSDGTVTPCCGDLRADLCIGTLPGQRLDTLVRGETYRKLRMRIRKGALPARCRHCQEYVPEGVPNKTLRPRQ